MPKINTVRDVLAGDQITEPGLYNVPIGRYHNDPDLFPGHSVSSTGLRMMARRDACPKKYFFNSCYNPDRPAFKTTEALRFGKAVHAYLLENDLPEDEFAYHEFKDFKTNEGHKGAYVDPDTQEIYSSYADFKKKWKKQQEDAGKTIFTSKDIDIFQKMADALRQDQMISDGLLSGMVETTIVYQDPTTGIWVKCRPDIIPSDTMLGDYKTAEEASPFALSASLGKYAYHQQLALSVEAIARVLNKLIETSFIVAQEKSEPFVHTILPINDNAIWWGARQNRLALDRIKWCLDNERWPSYSKWDAGAGGYVEGPQDIDLPKYYEDGLKRQDELEGMPDVNIKNLITG